MDAEGGATQEQSPIKPPINSHHKKQPVIIMLRKSFSESQAKSSILADCLMANPPYSFKVIG